MTIEQQWRLLPHSNGPAEQELAHGVALLGGLAVHPQPALRWYGAASPALVIGSGQKPSEIDRAACAAAGISLHRRASGGTAVFFSDAFLMQDVALPPGHPLQRGDVSESYRWLGAVWAATLARFGIDAALVEIPQARSDTQTLDPLVRRACFGGISPYEVLVQGRKLVGFSQIRRRAGTLLQVGIYRHWPGRELADLLAVAAAERATLVQRLAARVVGLDELLPLAPSNEALISAFATALREQHGVALLESEWSSAEQAAYTEALPRFAALPQAE